MYRIIYNGKVLREYKYLVPALKFLANCRDGAILEDMMDPHLLVRSIDAKVYKLICDEEGYEPDWTRFAQVVRLCLFVHHQNWLRKRGGSYDGPDNI